MNDFVVKKLIGRAVTFGAVALLSQSALAEQPHARDGVRAPESVRVTAPHDEIVVVDAKVEIDTTAIIERLRRALAKDIERDFESLGSPRIELVMAEVPTRG